MFSFQATASGIKATYGKGTVYNISSQKEIEKRLVAIAGTSKFEDAWIYDGKRLFDVGFRDPFLWNDPRGNYSILTIFDDILRAARGKKEITFYHIHPTVQYNQVNLMNVQDIEVDLMYFKKLQKAGVHVEFTAKVACKEGIYSLKITDDLVKLYEEKKGGFEDYVLGQSTKKEFELIYASSFQDRIFNKSGEMDKETVDELRRIQLAALESIGIKVTFTPAE